MEMDDEEGDYGEMDDEQQWKSNLVFWTICLNKY